MIIFTYSTLAKYFKANKCADVVKDAFNNWYTVMMKSDFANLGQLKKMFNKVDYAGNDRYVFNIMGNSYRIITMIHFRTRSVYVLFVGTHKEYDKVDARNVEYKNKV